MTPQIQIIRDIDHKGGSDPELFFVFEGELSVAADERTYALGAEDFMVVNLQRPCRIIRKKNGLVGRIPLSREIISEYVDLYRYEFECYSPQLREEHRRRLRRLIYQIFSNYYRGEGLEQLIVNAFYYQLIYRLCDGSLILRQQEGESAPGDADSELTGRILERIRRNYNQKISLSDLSDISYFSNAYLSKFIKKKTGRNFLELLNEERLGHALDELENSGKTIMKIALDNGFPNTASFGRIFRETYNESPSDYRKRIRKEKKAESVQADSPWIEEKVRDFLESHRESYALNEQSERLLTCSVSDARPVEQPWRFLMNGGTAGDLLRADVRQHILMLHRELKFSYIRFWDIYAPELLLREKSSTENRNEAAEYNFSRLDMIIDFLLENEMRPYIELGNKPFLLMQSSVETLSNIRRTEPFSNLQEYSDFLHSMVRHYVNRYGIEEVEKWYFEQWRSAEQNDLKDYFETFETVYRTVKYFSSGIQVGGGGFNRDQYNLFSDIIEAWKKRPVRPDFVSIYSYPFINRPGRPSEGQSRDMFFMRKYLDHAASVLKAAGFDENSIHLTEWNFTISSRNPLNDSVFKGAYVMRNLIDQTGRIKMSGYWTASDLYSEFYDSGKIIAGGSGLITKDGIRKPAFYGYDFMCSLERYLLGAADNAMVTGSLHDNYSIVCCGYAHPSYRYYAKPEKELSPAEIETYFDGETVRYSFIINGVKNGRYQIRIRRVNREYGSVQDEWLRMGLTNELSARDIRYLQQVCVPRITIGNTDITDNVLRIETTLSENEIQHIQILYQLS